MQVVEDVDEGAAVAGLKARPARSAEELRALFNIGRANRDMQARGIHLLPAIASHAPLLQAALCAGCTARLHPPGPTWR